MRHLWLSLAASAAVLAFGLTGNAGAPEGYRVSGPFVHENLAIYFVHGKGRPDGPVPLTLEEALQMGTVRVHETSNVNELEIENLAAEEVFVQTGDIVKGGKQDRVITSSLVLPPRSGRVPIASFCVEQGRWTARGAESAQQFSSSPSAVPSRKAKIAMRAASPTADPRLDSVAARQGEVWRSVAETQSRLSANLGAPVAAPQSRTSLQLSLENEKLAEVRAAYVKALAAAGEKDGDIVGFVFAVNGKVNSADVYPSNGLFRKMWQKLLTASATEAIGEKDGMPGTPPAKETVLAFLDAAQRRQGERARHRRPGAARDARGAGRALLRGGAAGRRLGAPQFSGALRDRAVVSGGAAQPACIDERLSAAVRRPRGRALPPRWRSPQRRMTAMTGMKLWPVRVRRYSTLGGTTP